MHKVLLSAFLGLATVALLSSTSLAATYVDSAHGSVFTCNYACHVLHGAGGSTLVGGSNAQTLCLSCHGPGGTSTLKAAIHRPAGLLPGDITCLECHNPHADRDNVEGALNDKLVGFQYDYNAYPVVAYALASIRQETTSGLGAVNNVVFQTAADFSRPAGNGPCQICHAAGPVAGTGAFANHAWGTDCSVCHLHGDGFAKHQCVECHDTASGLSATAPKVLTKAGITAAAVGAHLRVLSADAVVGLNDAQWTTRCVECHTGHSGDVLIPNKTGVGISYLQTGGIGLGGSATLVGATSEAEICWSCHDTNGISEWGGNTDTNGTAANYNFGGLYAVDQTTPVSNWVDAWWKSGTAKFSYKTGRIQSTHSANDAVVGSGVDAVDELRCSYCHDVHELALAPNDSKAGKPYLRGSWMGNPYREDGAPQALDTWSTNGSFGAVPRGGTQATQQGGYQIDQNNGDPTTGGLPAQQSPVTAAWDLTNSAGLCVLCHGNDVDNLNQFGDSADAWVGVLGNGHSNAVIGGTGSHTSNIFSMAMRNPSTAPLYTAKGSSQGAPRLAYGNAGAFTDTWPFGDNNTDFWAYGFRSQNSNGFTLSPQVTAAMPFAYRAYNWGASVDDTPDPHYHKFSCSKCHNPHASRLPRLMISNCLDTKHNTWDDRATVSTLGTTTTYAPENRGVTFAMATSAQNCHRLADKANFPNATGDGWNRVTPWTVEGTQDNPGIP